MKAIQFFSVSIIFILPLRADDEITVPLDFGSGGLTKALAVRATVGGFCRSSGRCIAYEIQKVARTDPDTPAHDPRMETMGLLNVQLQFDVGGLCNKKPSQWSTTNEYLFFIPQKQEVPIEDTAGCTVDLVKVTLISAKDGSKVLAHNESPEIDFTDALKTIQAKRDVEEARQKRLAAERKQKEAAEAARLARIQAAQDAKAAEERARIRAGCSSVYQSTIDKKVTDLTVREEQQVRACQALGFYPPR